MKRRVVIVGAGALGSHVALFLRNEAVDLRVIDDDRVESKNTLAQVHTRQGLGRNKAMALQQTLNGLWGVKIDAVPSRLGDTNAWTLLDGAGLVLDCTDNIATRKGIAHYVTVAGIPCLHGALSADGTFGRIVWEPWFTPDAEGAPGQATCEGGEHLPFFALVGAQMAVIVQEFLATGVQRSVQVTPGGVVRLV